MKSGSGAMVGEGVKVCDDVERERSMPQGVSLSSGTGVLVLQRPLSSFRLAEKVMGKVVVEKSRLASAKKGRTRTEGSSYFVVRDVF